MKFLKFLCFAAVVLGSSLAFAQGGGSPAPAQQPAPSIASATDRQVTILEREFVSVAEAMPEDKYNFSPDSLKIKGSDYKGVRTFAAEVKHVANTNFQLWAPITGEKPDYDLSNDDGPANVKTKAEIIQFLKASFALGHRAARSLTPENSSETVKTFFGDTPRIFAATFSVAHAFDHYGQMVEYLRMNGIIPPPSRPQQPATPAPAAPKPQ